MTHPALTRPRTLRSTIAHAALLDVGRPDLAASVGTNRAGNSTCIGGFPAHPVDDQKLLARAFRLGHQADPEGCPDPERCSHLPSVVEIHEQTLWLRRGGAR